MLSFHPACGTRAKWRAWRGSQATKSTKVKAGALRTRWWFASSYQNSCDGQSDSTCVFASRSKREAQFGPADGS
jgi:hypothetical protein